MNHVLSRIALTYLRAGTADKALKAAERALEITASLEEQRGFILNEPLVQALTVLLSAGRTDHALSEVAAVPNGFRRGWVLEQLSLAIVQAGVVDDALKIAASIDDDHYRRYAIAGIIRAMHQADKADEIVAVVEELHGDAGEIDLLSDAALRLHQLGRHDDAQRVVNKAILAAERALSVKVARAEDGMIDDPLPWTLIAIANALVKVGRAHEGAQVANAIRDIANQSQDASLGSLLFAIAAKILAKAGEDDEAAAAAAAAVDGSETAHSESRWPSEGRRAAHALAKGGFYNQALSIAATVNHPTARMLAYSEVATIVSARGDIQQVLAASSAIRDQARTIDPASAALALALLAQALCRIGQDALAGKVIDEAHDAATKATDEEIRASALDAVAVALVQTSERAAAMRTVHEIRSAERQDRSLCVVAVNVARMGDVRGAVAIVEAVSSVFWRARALFDVVEAAVASSGTDSAIDVGVIDRFMVLASAMPVELGRYWVLSLITRILVRCGRRMKAMQLTQQLSAFVEAGPPSDRAMGLVAVAHALAAVGNTARAAETIQGAVADVEMYRSDAEKARVFDQMANLLIERGLYELAPIVWRARLGQAQFLGRREMLGVLGQGVPLIAQIDGGRGLWREYEVIMEIEEWRGSNY